MKLGQTNKEKSQIIFWMVKQACYLTIQLNSFLLLAFNVCMCHSDIHKHTYSCVCEKVNNHYLFYLTCTVHVAINYACGPATLSPYSTLPHTSLISYVNQNFRFNYFYGRSITNFKVNSTHIHIKLKNRYWLIWYACSRALSKQSG